MCAFVHFIRAHTHLSSNALHCWKRFFSEIRFQQSTHCNATILLHVCVIEWQLICHMYLQQYACYQLSKVGNLYWQTWHLHVNAFFYFKCLSLRNILKKLQDFLLCPFIYKIKLIAGLNAITRYNNGSGSLVFILLIIYLSCIKHCSYCDQIRNVEKDEMKI